MFRCFQWLDPYFIKALYFQPRTRQQQLSSPHVSECAGSDQWSWQVHGPLGSNLPGPLWPGKELIAECRVFFLPEHVMSFDYLLDCRDRLYWRYFKQGSLSTHWLIAVFLHSTWLEDNMQSRVYDKQSNKKRSPSMYVFSCFKGTAKVCNYDSTTLEWQ